MTHHPTSRPNPLAAVLWGLLTLALVGVLGGCDDSGDPVDDAALDLVDDADAPGPTSCGDAVCARHESCCDETCVNPAVDTGHCGACGIACGAGETCIDGFCTCAGDLCTVDERCCTDATAADAMTCLDVTSDPDHCGGCGVTCGDGQRCQDGQCVCILAGGAVDFCDADETCCQGLGCRDTSSDPLHCGACGSVCGSGELCDEGLCSCGAETGPPGGTACGRGGSCCGDPATCHGPDDDTCSCGSAVCAAGQDCCEVTLPDEAPRDVCTLTQRDVNHCGACGEVCGAGQSCFAGACGCQDGLADCNGDPADGCERRLSSDAANCGSCGNACAPGEVCNGLGECETSCQLGLTECDGSCVDLLTRNDHCGGCGVTCAAGDVCNGSGLCSPNCDESATFCDGECVDTSTDVRHCGGCGLSCGDGEVCDGSGQCALSCQPGFQVCAGQCVDVRSDRRHCGACGSPCAPGQVCDGTGQCAATCPPTYPACDGTCTDIRVDPAHCGACGNACAPGQSCVAGSCTTLCPSGRVACPPSWACIDPSEDRLHCGACGNACAAGERCDGGTCLQGCPPGESVCDGACVQTSSNPAHCGACGASCHAGQICVGGDCECRPGFKSCGGVCVDTRVADGHCGGCGIVCATNEACSDGQCVCPLGLERCLGVAGCLDLDSDPQHCGACGQSCDAGESCSQGVCGARTEALGSGNHHVCVLDESGKVRCWGANGQGQVGTSASHSSADSVLVTRSGVPLDAVAIAAGGASSCAVDSQGQAWCWGELAGSSEPVRVVDRNNVAIQGLVGIAVGPRHACAWTAAGRALCWGQGDRGALGDACGSLGSCQGKRLAAYVRDSDGALLGNVRQVVVGGALLRPDADPLLGTPESHGFACALVDDTPSDDTDAHRVVCWGDGDLGQLGDESTCNCAPGAPCFSSVAVDVERTATCTAIATPARATSLTAGAASICATLGDPPAADPVCWGLSTSGTLASGTNPGPTRDLVVPGTVTQLVSGAGHVCVRLDDGQVWCEGDNELGQTGQPASTPDVPALTQVALPTAAVDLVAGAWHTCARLDDGSLHCWGYDGFSQLGRYARGLAGSAPARATSTPREVYTDDTAAISAGGSRTCALGADGFVDCWGITLDPTAGKGPILVDESARLPAWLGAPTADVVSGVGSGATAIAVGTHHACAIRTSDDQVVCWGRGHEGQLGSVFDAANSATCAAPDQVDATHTVEACRNHERIAQPNLSFDNTLGGTPPITAPTDVLASGSQHSCAAVSASTLVCWGSNRFGQQDPTDLDRWSTNPIGVLHDPGETILDMAGGLRHSCVLLDVAPGAREIGCIGMGPVLGDPANPTDIQAPAADWTAIASGEEHVCALESTGTVSCWGANDRGQLGTGNRIATPTPVPVGGALTGKIVTHLALGPHHSCALTDAAEVYCWGANDSGQLGNDCDPAGAGGQARCEADELLPVAVVGLPGTPIELAAAGLPRISPVDLGLTHAHTCALVTPAGGGADTVYCWGSGSLGALTDAVHDATPAPVIVNH